MTVALPPCISTEYRLTHDGVLTVTFQPARFGTEKQTAQRRVTAEGWQLFQQRIALLQINRWKRQYSPSEGIEDGYHWELRLISSHTRIESSGDNAGPDQNNPSETLTLAQSADTILADALSELWTHSKATG